MTDFELWIYRGGLLILLMILGYLAKDIMKELKKIAASIAVLTNQGMHQQDQIISIKEKLESHETRLNTHRDQIRLIEREMDGCSYCKEK